MTKRERSGFGVLVMGLVIIGAIAGCDHRGLGGVPAESERVLRLQNNGSKRSPVAQTASSGPRLPSGATGVMSSPRPLVLGSPNAGTGASPGAGSQFDALREWPNVVKIVPVRQADQAVLVVLYDPPTAVLSWPVRVVGKGVALGGARFEYEGLGQRLTFVKSVAELTWPKALSGAVVLSVPLQARGFQEALGANPTVTSIRLRVTLQDAAGQDVRDQSGETVTLGVTCQVL